MNTYQKEYEKYYYSLQKQVADDKRKDSEDYKDLNEREHCYRSKKLDINRDTEEACSDESYINKDFQEENYDDLIIEKRIYNREKEKKNKGRVDRFIFQLGATFAIMAFYVGALYICPPVFNEMKSYTQKYCSSHELEYQSLSKTYDSINWEEAKSYIINNYNYFKGEIRSLL